MSVFTMLWVNHMLTPEKEELPLVNKEIMATANIEKVVILVRTPTVFLHSETVQNRKT